jgi:hypothetical protein
MGRLPALPGVAVEWGLRLQDHLLELDRSQENKVVLTGSGEDNVERFGDETEGFVPFLLLNFGSFNSVAKCAAVRQFAWNEFRTRQFLESWDPWGLFLRSIWWPSSMKKVAKEGP